VVAFEDPIEIVQAGATISQRELGPHAPTPSASVAAAMREAADAIVIGSVASPEAAAAVLDAVAAGHLVLATVSSPTAREAYDRLVDHLPPDRRERARQVLGPALLGTLLPVPRGAGGRAIEAIPGRDG
jgi:Tfp pilus assembly pilus retraction ATPase PilT